ncbi:MAG: TIGR03986 family CRISPR-associated RAMP protein [Pirellulaceae bacterium]|nr:TIGR03986 family CRISPR-associated RAMP protein [Pirellulaceae bacterium]
MTQNEVTIQGELAHVDSERRFAFVRPLGELPGYVRTRRDGTLHMHGRVLGELAHVGDQGTFLIVPGNEQSWTVRRVIRWEREEVHVAAPESRPRPTPTRGKTFVHPYNFVSLPACGLADAQGVSPFARSSAPSHATYDPERLSGHIDCQLRTLGPWFIPDPRKLVVEGQGEKHKTLGYFTFDEASGWDENRVPDKDGGEPALPAASLRGMIRGVFEAATLSCLSVFDNSPLDFRMGRDLEDQADRTPHGRAAPRYLPCRIINVTDRTVSIEFLDGRAKDDDKARPSVLRVAPMHAYMQSVKYRTDRRDPNSEKVGTTVPGWADLVTLPDGKQWTGNRVAAVIATVPGALSNRSRDRFQVREVLRAVRADGDALSADGIASLQAVQSDPQHKARQPCVVFGYLHRTGPNIENKHHERIFFRWTDYNPIKADDNSPEMDDSIEDRFQKFLIDDARTEDPGTGDGVYKSIPIEVFNESLQRLGEYSDRQPGKDAARIEAAKSDPPRMLPDQGGPTAVGPPYPSDFVRRDSGQVSWKRGDTCYALVEGQGKDAVVHGLYPVAIPRLRHEDLRGDLLPFQFFPCSAKHVRCASCDDSSQHYENQMCRECFERDRHLCPACRVFGWVRDLSGVGREGRKDRVDSVAGHVWFTHGRYVSGDYLSSERVPLAKLGSPKPTTTLFYLGEQRDFSREKGTRWPPALQKIRQPLYRRLEALLRGRKFYRRRLGADPKRSDPRRNGLRHEGDKRGGQNQSVFPLPKDMVFSFRVHFDNLTPEELGALLFAIELTVPASQRARLPGEARLCHAIGHGKPLGMGACEIAVTSLVLHNTDAADANSRYRQWTISPEGSDKQTYIEAFGKAWDDAVAANPALRQSLEDLLEMLRCDWPAGETTPIHYPPNPSTSEFDEIYKWFMENVKARNDQRGEPGGQFKPLPTPADERNEPDQRLPVNPKRPS